MSKIELPKDTRDALSRALTHHLKKEFDLEVAGFDAVFLLDYLAETLGPHFYNQGLHDAQAILHGRFEQVSDAIYELEKPVKFT